MSSFKIQRKNNTPSATMPGTRNCKTNSSNELNFNTMTSPCFFINNWFFETFLSKNVRSLAGIFIKPAARCRVISGAIFADHSHIIMTTFIALQSHTSFSFTSLKQAVLGLLHCVPSINRVFNARIVAGTVARVRGTTHRPINLVIAEQMAFRRNNDLRVTTMFTRQHHVFVYFCIFLRQFVTLSQGRHPHCCSGS